LLSAVALGADAAAGEGGAQDPSLAAFVATHGCVECHGAGREGVEAHGLVEGRDGGAVARAAFDARRAPRLAGASPVGARVRQPWLRAFLADPRAVHPGGHHPHQLAGLEGALRDEVAADLTAFLAGAVNPESEPVRLAAGDLEHGRRLFHSVGCVACHGPQELLEDLEWTLLDWQLFEAGETAAPSLPDLALEGDIALPPDLAAKYTLGSLAQFLGDPLAVRPSGHMPDLQLDASAARDVAAYLLRTEVLGEDGRFALAPGLLLRAESLPERGSLDAESPDDLPPPTARRLRVVKTVDVRHGPTATRFALRYEGLLRAPRAGVYTFYLTSDDGSWLDVDGARVIDNGGDHSSATESGEVELTEGDHRLELVMYENRGGAALKLEWQGPGLRRGSLSQRALQHAVLEYPGFGPATTTSAAAGITRAGDPARGREAFVALGCVTCHGDVDATPFAQTLDKRWAAPERCLATEEEEGARWVVPAEMFEALTALVAPRSDAGAGALAALATELCASPATRVALRFETRSCLRCHQRGDLGGVASERRGFFRGAAGADLGDEGRLPPHLTRIGHKLETEGLRAALDATARVRPYLETRMPRFGLENIGDLAEDLGNLDRGSSEAVEAERVSPSTAGRDLALGRRLAGNQGGLGCVQCHDFLGTPSLGVRAVDLGTMHARLRWPWFRELLLDPSAVNMNTRMTAVFVDGVSPVHDVFGGDAEQQIAALWSYLAQGEAMAPPPGARSGDAEYEIEPIDRVRMVGVFLRDVSPRVLCVGTPEGVHAAFDLQNGRLAEAWRGRFLNVRGTWEGRAGKLERAPTDDVLRLPEGPVCTCLESRDARWPATYAPRITRRTPPLDGAPPSRAVPIAFEHEAFGGTVQEMFWPEASALRESSRPAASAGRESLRADVADADVAHADVADALGRQVTFTTRGALPTGLAVLLARGAAIEADGQGAWRVLDTNGAQLHRVVHLTSRDAVSPQLELVQVRDEVTDEMADELRALPGASVEGRFVVTWRVEW